jgi:hypothetical protein
LAFGFVEALPGTVFESCLRLGGVRPCKGLHFGGSGLSPRRLHAHILHAAIRRHDVGHILVVLFQLHKVGNIEEGVAFQANVNKGRLHAGQYAGYAPFVDGPCQGVFIFALEIDFREQIVFHQTHLGFVGRGRDK